MVVEDKPSKRRAREEREIAKINASAVVSCRSDGPRVQVGFLSAGSILGIAKRRMNAASESRPVTFSGRRR